MYTKISSIVMAAVLWGVVAQGQTVPGNRSGSSGTPTGNGFSSTASISSVLSFTITDNVLDCGTVGYATTSCAGTAAISVSANSPWGIAINNGLFYSTSESNYVDMTNDDIARFGSFTLDLAASPNAVSTTQVPAVAQNVTISGTVRHGASSAEVVDVTDEYGSYSGYFIVALFER